MGKSGVGAAVAVGMALCVVGCGGTSVGSPPAAPGSTSTVLVSDFVSPVTGTSVLLTATVSATSATPAGSVNFYDGTTLLGSGTVSAGTASYATSALAVGAHTVTAAFAGTSTLAASTSSGVVVTVSAAVATNHILFVGDSFTHGRYLPVRTYNSSNDTDENYGVTGTRAETTAELGPYGGVPGIFAKFAAEAGLSYDVHVETISATSLQNNYAAAASVIAKSTWNTVVLQEVSDRPLTRALSGSSTSNPSNFCGSVVTIEAGVHAVAPAAKIYLYETWPRADEAQALGASTYAANLTALANQYHNVYYRAMSSDGHIADVAAVGDAWLAAMNAGTVTANPYTTPSGTSLWYLSNATNNPAISAPDYYHPSVYGAYLSALVIFYRITGVDPRTLGSSEGAAAALGISPAMAVQLQQAAYTQITTGTSAPVNSTVSDPCTVTG